MKLVTPEQMREMDRRTIEDVGLPGMLLMERAALGAVRVALRAIEDTFGPGLSRAARTRRRSVGILCGGGNNGGDGIAMAHLLAERRYTPAIVLLSPAASLPPDAALNLEIAQKLGLELHDPSAVAPEDTRARLEQIRDAHLLKGALVAWCDALLGTGLDRAPEGRYAPAVAL